MVGSTPIAWKAGKQSMVAMSVCAAALMQGSTCALLLESARADGTPHRERAGAKAADPAPRRDEGRPAKPATMIGMASRREVRHQALHRPASPASMTHRTLPTQRPTTTGQHGTPTKKALAKHRLATHRPGLSPHLALCASGPAAGDAAMIAAAMAAKKSGSVAFEGQGLLE
ncbi:unnamed protein product [Symbiodinium sp. KB8]|nr:unnamed protein product [Symbiodinium sp. KB8]